MAGTSEGAKKARDTNINKYGEDFYKKIGSKSWDNPERSHETGFALLEPELRAELGRKGGKKNKGKKYAKKEGYQGNDLVIPTSKIVYLSSEEAAQELKKAYPDVEKLKGPSPDSSE